MDETYRNMITYCSQQTPFVDRYSQFGVRRETFFGRALAVVRANRGGGTIRVRVTSPDYPAAEMVLGVREISAIDSSAIRTVPEDEGLLGEVLDEQ